MRAWTRLGLVPAMAVAALSCGSGGTDHRQAATAPIDGATVFADRCAGCHGADGSGSVGPSLHDVAERLSVSEQRAVIRGGRGRMPSFDAVLTAEEIAAVLTYTRERLG